jgi:hypothetical protein
MKTWHLKVSVVEYILVAVFVGLVVASCLGIPKKTSLAAIQTPDLIFAFGAKAHKKQLYPAQSPAPVSMPASEDVLALNTPTN